MKSFPRPLQQCLFAIRFPTASARLRPSQPHISNARIIATPNTSRTRIAFSTDPSLRKDRLDAESSQGQQTPPSTDHLAVGPALAKTLPTGSSPIEASSIETPPIESSPIEPSSPTASLPIEALPIKNSAEPLPRAASLAESSPTESSPIEPPLTGRSSTENSPQEPLSIDTAPTGGSLSEPSPIETSRTEASPTETLSLERLPAETLGTSPAESSLEENSRAIPSSASADRSPTETPPIGTFPSKAMPTKSSLAESSPAENPTEIQTLAEDSTSVSGQHDPDILRTARLPRSVQAIYLKPLKRKAQYGLPVCDLQLRSYSVRNLEFFADFALRAAYYLYLPASGPVPLPRITERWTVPRSSFIFKKSQENFQRITLRRLIQIQDGNPETVEIWLAFLRKHAYYGVGMKANVWAHEKLGVGKTMDVSLQNVKHVLEPKWAHFGRRKNVETSEKVFQLMSKEKFRQTGDGSVSETAMATGTPNATIP